MQDTNVSETTDVHQGSVVSFVVAFTASALLLWLGVFALHEWADTALLGHAVQHLVIFSSGCIMGGTLLRARYRRTRR